MSAGNSVVCTHCGKKAESFEKTRDGEPMCLSCSREQELKKHGKGSLLRRIRQINQDSFDQDKSEKDEEGDI